MGLTNVWLRTLADGLIRADQVVGVRAHPTPAAGGKPSHWLLDVVTCTAIGGGQPDSWAVGPLHRTLIQSGSEPVQACDHLVRLLAQLDAVSASGVITVSISEASAAASVTGVPVGAAEAAQTTVRFRFTPFPVAEPDSPQRDPEYL